MIAPTTHSGSVTSSRVAARIAMGQLVAGWRADVVHANDWHTGLLPVQLGDEPEQRPRTLFTIHNLAFQGLFSPSIVGALESCRVS